MAAKAECEIKFIEADHDHLRQVLKKIGAKHVFTANMITVAFRKEGSGYDAIRIRKINEKMFLTKKIRPGGDTLLQQEEESEITDWERTIASFKRDGFEVSRPNHKHREHYELNHLSFELERMEGIPPYLEIEAPSVDELKRACTLLGLDYAQGRNQTIHAIYPAMPRSWD
jgi:predicted adenylyl cyclase CyaB